MGYSRQYSSALSLEMLGCNSHHFGHWLNWLGMTWSREIEIVCFCSGGSQFKTFKTGGAATQGNTTKQTQFYWLANFCVWDVTLFSLPRGRPMLVLQQSQQRVVSHKTLCWPVLHGISVATTTFQPHHERPGQTIKLTLQLQTTWAQVAWIHKSVQERLRN